MALSTTSAGSILSPQQVDDLFIRPILRDSIAAQVARVVLVQGSSLRVPIVQADPQANWTLENSEIQISDPTISDIEIQFKALKGLTTVSNELLSDTSGLAATLVGEGLARDTAARIDAAYFGVSVTNGPSGLGSVSGVQNVSAGATFSTLDPFHEAISRAETVGARVGAFVTSPEVALALAQLKVSTGSNQHLLGPDATSPTSRSIAGIPLFVTSAVAQGTVWAVPADRTILAIRQAVEIRSDASAYFSKDATAVRSVARVGIAPDVHPQALVKITVTP
ncbi:phage major capsid protein [Rhodococcus oryzae]|uniref:phage major capsid protein n=1 Tax=Rhodococcus oryzae TaxID=2571143 RepID=UPI00371A767C